MRMRRHFVFALWLTLACLGAGQAFAARSLLPGLDYVTLAESAQLEASDHAIVIDARYPAAVEPPADAEAWLRSTLPILVLLGPESPEWLLAQLQANPSARRLTFAAKAAGLPVDLEIDTPLTDDRAAAARITGCTEVQWATLLGRDLQKRRFDEAALIRETSGEASDEPPPEPDAEPSEEEPADDEDTADADAEKPAETIAPDLVLQRAVQVYEGLRALKRW